MRILVTGHRGYIGTVMVPMLLEEGHDVVGLDSELFGEDCLLGDSVPQIPEFKMDVRDVDSRDLEGFDAVIHLANLSNDPLGSLNPSLTYEINYHGSVKLAEAAKRAGVGLFIHSSSCSMYGAAGDAVLDETAEFNPVTPYAKSKVLTEQAISKMAGDGFSPVFLRNATAYGVSPKLRGDLVLNNLTGWAFTTGKVLILSDGTPWRPIIHIADISRAFIAVLNAPREVVHNEAFNVAVPGENYQVRELAAMVEEVVPGSVVEYAKDGGPDPRCYRVDTTKIETLLPDFKPQWTARKGVEELYEAYKTNNLTEADLNGTRFQRIRHIEDKQETGEVDSTLRWTGSADDVALAPESQLISSGSEK